jgi:hypothetical protein
MPSRVPRKIIHRRGRVFLFARRQHVRHRYARCCRPAGSLGHITCKGTASEAGRSRVRPSAAIVAGKPTNKAEQSAAELVERRAGTEGNTSQLSTRRTPSRVSVIQDVGSSTAIHCRRYPRWEPYAGKPHVRICAGGREVTRVPTANIMVVRARAAPNPRLRYPQFQCSGLDRRRLLSGRYQHL